MRIGIINYSLGNVGSVYSAFQFYKYNVRLINKPLDLDTTDMIVLAGVGNFKTAVTRLKEFDFWEKLNEEVTQRYKPVIGICLGMQLFADVSYEGGENKGFGWIKGEVIRLPDGLVRIPHIGWDEIQALDNEMFKNIRYCSFYYMHSYHFVPEDKNVVGAKTNCGGKEIVAAVRKDNIIGVQFHPEKSQGDGLRLLKNCVELLACYIKE